MFNREESEKWSYGKRMIVAIVGGLAAGVLVFFFGGRIGLFSFLGTTRDGVAFGYGFLGWLLTFVVVNLHFGPNEPDYDLF